jgi:hypothetical protein
MSEIQKSTVNDLIGSGFRIYSEGDSVHLFRRDFEFNVVTLKRVDYDGEVKTNLRKGN